MTMTKIIVWTIVEESKKKKVMNQIVEDGDSLNWVEK
jgi:hypothetical protein